MAQVTLQGIYQSLAGHRMLFKIPVERTHLFDPDTGLRIHGSDPK